MNDDLRVNPRLVIPGDEIELRSSTSGGPGGQHANRSETRIDLAWNVAESRALGPRQRARILDKLGSRIDSTGKLHLSSARHRSQYRNREDVLDRLADLVADALRIDKPRVATGPTKNARERRLRAKKRRAQTKQLRKAPPPDD